MDDLESNDLKSKTEKLLENNKNSRLSLRPHLITDFKVPEIKPFPIQEHFEKTEEYQTKCLERLQSININTANRFILVDLISKSNEKQDEILKLIFEILTIAKAKEKREAESLFKKIVTKINNTVETTDSMIKLINWATLIYKLVEAMLQK